MNIPETYSAWRHCIEVDCGIALNAAYIRERLHALDDAKDFRTEQFVRLYGRPHWERLRGWFGQALRELEAA